MQRFLYYNSSSTSGAGGGGGGGGGAAAYQGCSATKHLFLEINLLCKSRALPGLVSVWVGSIYSAVNKHKPRLIEGGARAAPPCPVFTARRKLLLYNNPGA